MSADCHRFVIPGQGSTWLQGPAWSDWGWESDIHICITGTIKEENKYICVIKLIHGCHKRKYVIITYSIVSWQCFSAGPRCRMASSSSLFSLRLLTENTSIHNTGIIYLGFYCMKGNWGVMVMTRVWNQLKYMIKSFLKIYFIIILNTYGE